MKGTKIPFRASIALCVTTILLSCGNSSEATKEETPKAGDTTKIETTASASFNIMLIEHSVANYAKWKPGYDAHDSARKAYGITDGIVLRGNDDPNKLVLIEKITDVQQAKAFTGLPGLKDAMTKAGVTSKPAFSFYNVIRSDDAGTHTKDRVFITHRVKDFDSWVKVYDGEGKATRANEGMVDQLLARSIDDPNMLYIVFAVTDMAKAKAAIFSDAKKNLMTSAGVEGAPKIEFYQMAD
jgi:quinol monooxygenase YgiN